MDTSKIGLIAADAMEVFEQEYSDRPDAVIVEAAIVFEVRFTDEEGNQVVHTPTACTNDSKVYQTGLFDWGLDNVNYASAIREADEEAEDDD